MDTMLLTTARHGNMTSPAGYLGAPRKGDSGESFCPVELDVDVEMVDQPAQS
jgi:hypothetical protein